MSIEKPFTVRVQVGTLAPNKKKLIAMLRANKLNSFNESLTSIWIYRSKKIVLTRTDTRALSELLPSTVFEVVCSQGFSNAEVIRFLNKVVIGINNGDWLEKLLDGNKSIMIRDDPPTNRWVIDESFTEKR